MATFQVNEYDIDVNSKRLINSTSGGYGLDDRDKPRLYFDESVVWALSCFNRDLTAAAFAVSDTWELFVDVDFDHDLYAGTLQSALTTAAATTSVVINYSTAPTANTIPSTGGILLRDDDGNRERVPYTAVSGTSTTQVTYTTNTVLEYPYDAGDYAAQEDPLMISSDNDDFNVSGDWASLNVVGGKISAKVDCTNWKFQEKVQAYLTANPSANEVPVWVQINKYQSGASTPSVILQDLIYCKPSVRDIEQAASLTGPSWSLADARYLQVFNLQGSATEAIAQDDLLTFYNASTSGVQKDTVGNFRREIINSNATTAYTLAATDAGKTVAMTSASANQVLLPSSTGVTFNDGDVIAVARDGAGVTTIACASTSATLNGTADGEGIIDNQYNILALVHRAADTWFAYGNYTETTT